MHGGGSPDSPAGSPQKYFDAIDTENSYQLLSVIGLATYWFLILMYTAVSELQASTMQASGGSDMYCEVYQASSFWWSLSACTR